MSSSKQLGPSKGDPGVRSTGALVLDSEERRRRAEVNLVGLLDATPDGILIHRELRYVYANRAALELVGHKREDVIGRSPFELVPPRFRMLLAERIMEAYTTRARMPEVEERLLHASGAEVPVEVVTIPFIFEGEVSTLVHIRDITARRELERRSRRRGSRPRDQEPAHLCPLEPDALRATLRQRVRRRERRAASTPRHRPRGHRSRGGCRP